MIDASGPPRDLISRIEGVRRNTGLGGKALLVCLLALLTAIPGMFVFGLVAERSHRANGVVNEVSVLQGGTQRVLGPLWVAPYDLVSEKGVHREGWYIVSPDQGVAQGEVKTQALHRGISDVPVYEVNLEYTATFAPLAKPASAAIIDWSWARLVFGSFFRLSATMYLTRNTEWYGARPAHRPTE